MLLGAGQFNAGVLDFSALSLVVAAGDSIELLVTADTAPVAQLAPGETYQISTAAAAFGADSVFVGRPIAVSGATQTGTLLTVPPPSLDIVAGPAHSTTPLSVFPSATGIAMTQLQLTAGSSAPLQVTGLAVSASGSADDPTAVAGLRLFVDENGDGLLDGGDTLIQNLASPFSTDNGTANLSFSRTLAPSAVERWLLVYDLSGSAANGATLTATISAGAVTVGVVSSIVSVGIKVAVRPSVETEAMV